MTLDQTTTALGAIDHETERQAFESCAQSMGFNIDRDESAKYRDYHRATTRFVRDGWLSALAWAKNSGLLVSGVLLEAKAEGFDTIEDYVESLKQSRSTYFLERNSARDALRARDRAAAASGAAPSPEPKP